MNQITNTPVVLIESDEYNSGWVRTVHLFPSATAAREFIKKEMECDDIQLRCAKEPTLSPACECYSFDDFVYHIHTQPVEHI